MANRLLFIGKQTGYDDLVYDLQEGEQLMAAYYLSHPRRPCITPVSNEGSFDEIMEGAYDNNEPQELTGWSFFSLRWYASTTGSINPTEYGIPG